MKYRALFLFTLLLFNLSPLRVHAAQNPAPAWDESESVPGELIALMQPRQTARSLRLPSGARASATRGKGLEKINALLVEVPKGQESAYLAKLKQTNGIRAVEPNYRIQAAFLPNDPGYVQQYAPTMIQAESAWNVETGSAGVTLAVIDSGLDSVHPEFTGRILPGYDFIENDSTPQDSCGHGTHVTGIAAAAGNNLQGMAGIAWGIHILPVRVLDDNCGGDYADVASGILWATEQGADIINLSLGSDKSSTLMENATYYAYTHGVALFAASGNTGTSPVYYPAAYDWVMAVGAVDSGATRASTSTFGSALDLAAPGVDIYSTLPTHSGFLFTRACEPLITACEKSPAYDKLSGTSMAAAHVSGAAALLLSHDSTCAAPAALYEALTQNAQDLGVAGRDDEYGYGLLQIADALSAGCLPAPPPATAPFSIEYDWARSDTCNALAQYQWRDASGGVLRPTLNNEDKFNVALPFPFTLGTVTYNDITLHANGFISMGNANTEDLGDPEKNYNTNDRLPGIAKPNNFIAPFWDNLTDIGYGKLYTLLDNSVTPREFIIEYRGYQRFGVSGSLNFEAILFEGNGEILYQYKTLQGAGSDGSQATIGVELENGLAGFPYAYNERSALREGLALRFFPYSSGSPNLPSDPCPNTRAITLEAGTPSACFAAPGDFDIEIPAGELPYRAIWKAIQTDSAPQNLPAAYLDMKQYADLRLSYSPPAPSLAPMPAAQVCYAYTPQDLIRAGGHAENLFLAAYDDLTKIWQPLPTLVDGGRGRLLAYAPHFSHYGVATLNPKTSNDSNGLNLPITGAALSPESLAALILLLGGLAVFSLRKR